MYVCVYIYIYIYILQASLHLGAAAFLTPGFLPFGQGSLPRSLPEGTGPPMHKQEPKEVSPTPDVRISPGGRKHSRTQENKRQPACQELGGGGELSAAGQHPSPTPVRSTGCADFSGQESIEVSI